MTETKPNDGEDEEQTVTSPVATTWTTGEKYAVGTAADHASDDPSKTWFTLTEGALTEPRFPRIDLLNASALWFVVTDRDGYVAHTHIEQGTEDTLERTAEPTESDALSFRQAISETDQSVPSWTLELEYVTDTERDAIVCDFSFDAEEIYDVWLVCDPTPSGRAEHTLAEVHSLDGGHVLSATDTGEDGILMTDEDGDPHVVSLAIANSAGGEVGFTDAAVFERSDAAVEQFGSEHEGGSDSETGVVTLVSSVALDVTCAEETIALGFATGGDTDAAIEAATAAATDEFEQTRHDYVSSWRDYLDGLDVPDSVAGDDALADQYRSAAMVLKAVEDKTYSGAGIASPSVPWGEGVENQDAGDYGYNFVWARDLYQVFTAFDAMGDRESAIDALEYVFAYQHDGDGFLPQNTFVDGRTRWSGEQLDEIAFPLVMAYQLRARHDYGFDDADYDYRDVRELAEYVVHSGPATEQERWEEEDGFSPSTIAAEIAGLICAAELAEEAGDETDALVYRAVADHWRRSVGSWCATTTGADGHEQVPYYVRVNDDTDPDDGAPRSLANGGPTLDERAVVDAGFLELVRLGVLPWDDPTVRNSLAVVDDTIRVDTPNGPAWYRYNGDGYGEQGPDGSVGAGAPWSISEAGKGRLWPIFTGERGEYELLAGTESGDFAPANLLRTMRRFANTGRMIPEQVWDREEPSEFGWEFGEGIGSATPLAWSMAQYVRLSQSLDVGEPVETPRPVAERYVGSDLPAAPAIDVSWPESVVDESEVTIRGATSVNRVLVRSRGRTVEAAIDDDEFSATLELEPGRNSVTVVAVGEDDVDAAAVDVGDEAGSTRSLAVRQGTVSVVE
ncbi:glycoside hydrolase family 15 protein [Haloarchaeobius sp. DFWS5]|uniref:glycoside hydrolase family 15 protein n=1 Tax=Haloarchaeobius sp. DFWS5 TaxID=3446114 RepID=UPI003EBCE7CD